jgi:chromosome segregation ATPase
MEVCERVASVETEVKGVNRHMEQMTLQNEKILERLSDLKDRVTEKSALITQHGERMTELEKRIHHVEVVQKLHQALFDKARWSWKTMTLSFFTGVAIFKALTYFSAHFTH